MPTTACCACVARTAEITEKSRLYLHIMQPPRVIFVANAEYSSFRSAIRLKALRELPRNVNPYKLRFFFRLSPRTSQN